MDNYHPSINAERVMELLEINANALADDGLCLQCGSEVSGVEPDAEAYDCPECGSMRVFGLEWILLNLF